MVELLAALAVAPWTQPVRFLPLPAWHTGSSGTLESSYGPVPGVALHDLALHCENGDAHLQIAYRGGTLSGLVLLDGPPTGRFGR